MHVIVPKMGVQKRLLRAALIVHAQHARVMKMAAPMTALRVVLTELVYGLLRITYKFIK